MAEIIKQKTIKNTQQTASLNSESVAKEAVKFVKKPVESAKKIKKPFGKVKAPKKPKFKFLKSLWLKEVVLGIVNLVLVLITIIFLGRLPQRAEEFKKARNASISSTTKSEVEVAQLEIAAKKEEAESLSILFADESGLINFVREIDILKEEGLVTGFSFAGEKAVKDKTGQLGIPIVIEFAGSWFQIGQGLARLNDLPFLLRPITLDIDRGGPDENLIIFKYGGVIYVDESFAKN